jgi:hypothetical protein
MGAYSKGLGPRKRGPRSRERDGPELPLFDQRPHKGEPDGIERPKPLPGQMDLLPTEGVPDGDG